MIEIIIFVKEIIKKNKEIINNTKEIIIFGKVIIKKHKGIINNTKGIIIFSKGIIKKNKGIITYPFFCYICIKNQMLRKKKHASISIPQSAVVLHLTPIMAARNIKNKHGYLVTMGINNVTAQKNAQRHISAGQLWPAHQVVPHLELHAQRPFCPARPGAPCKSSAAQIATTIARSH